MAQHQDRNTANRSGHDARTVGDSGLQNFRYRAVICYSHENQARTDCLIRPLETNRVPARLTSADSGAGTIPSRFTPIFRDRDEPATDPRLVIVNADVS